MRCAFRAVVAAADDDESPPLVEDIRNTDAALRECSDDVDATAVIGQPGGRGGACEYAQWPLLELFS
jgi:hypothetical protein